MKHTSGPRERLIQATREATYHEGLSVGIAAILEQADVAKQSLYQHFGGKDELVAETLRLTAAADMERYRTAMDQAGDQPRARLLALFDAVVAVVGQPDFRGCRYMMAGLSIAAETHPALPVIRAYKSQLLEMSRQELTALGHGEPEAAAAQLLLIMDGTLAAALMQPQTQPVVVARALAERVIDKN